MAEAKPEVMDKPGSRTRQRSTVAFPYMPLDSAIDLAKALHDNNSRGECSDEQLAAWSNQSPKSSTFRVQIYAGRTFGLLSGEGRAHRLTDLGLSILDPDRAREARVKAFLEVPLFRIAYDAYKGVAMPPAAAIERDMVRWGVSDKVKDRARQVLERSAEQAGFFEHGKTRMVMPGIQAAATNAPSPSKPSRFAGGGGGGNWGNLDPLIEALIQKLPKDKEEWGVDERIAWLQMITMAFNMTYGAVEPIEVRKGT